MPVFATPEYLVGVVLALHFTIVLFIVGGLALVILGNAKQWHWVNAAWFRVAHLAAITAVIAEAWLGVICPFTSLEMWLRARAGVATYSGGFVEHWLQRLIYYEAPGWVFLLGYSLFGLVVVGTWWLFPPRFARSHARGA
jgi:hypothetical protein